MSVETDLAFLKQKIEEIDRKINQLTLDMRKISSNFAEKEVTKEKSTIDIF